MLDIKRLLSDHGIYWTDKSNNTMKGCVTIKCILCGVLEDPSTHLNISLSGNFYKCLRNPAHRGRDIPKLLARLGIYVSHVDFSIEEQLLNRTYFDKPRHKEESKEYTRCYELPDYLIPIGKYGTMSDTPFINYLVSRGFPDPNPVVSYFNLHRGTGMWAGRLILPVEFEDEVTWVGRTIRPDDKLRYLTPNNTTAKNVKNTIANYNQIVLGGDKLVIGEGPVDFMKAAWFLRGKAEATCTFGLSIHEFQVALLQKVCKQFNQVYLCFDKLTTTESMWLLDRLPSNVKMVVLDRKDLGDMNEWELTQMIS